MSTRNRHKSSLPTVSRAIPARPPRPHPVTSDASIRACSMLTVSTGSGPISPTFVQALSSKECGGAGSGRTKQVAERCLPIVINTRIPQGMVSDVAVSWAFQLECSLLLLTGPLSLPLAQSFIGPRVQDYPPVIHPSAKRRLKEASENP